MLPAGVDVVGIYGSASPDSEESQTLEWWAKASVHCAPVCSGVGDGGGSGGGLVALGAAAAKLKLFSNDNGALKEVSSYAEVDLYGCFFSACWNLEDSDG